MDGFEMIDEAPLADENGGYYEDAQTETDMDAEMRITKIIGWESYRKKWIDHYQRLIDEVNDRADRNIAWHKYHLSRFFETVPHKATKTTSYYDGLPSCRLVMSRATDKINKPSRDDLERILLRLAEEKDTAMIKTTTTEEVDWQKYKENLAIVDGKVVDMRTGEFVDDVQITHCEPELTLKLKNDKKERNENEDHGNPDA